MKIITTKKDLGCDGFDIFSATDFFKQNVNWVTKK